MIGIGIGICRVNGLRTLVIVTVSTAVVGETYNSRLSVKVTPETTVVGIVTVWVSAGWMKVTTDPERVAVTVVGISCVSTRSIVVSTSDVIVLVESIPGILTYMVVGTIDVAAGSGFEFVNVIVEACTAVLTMPVVVPSMAVTTPPNDAVLVSAYVCTAAKD